MENRLKKISTAVGSLGADLCLLQSFANRLYTTGLNTSAGMVVLGKEDKRYFIVDSRYQQISEEMLKPHGFNVIITQGNYNEDIAKIVKQTGAKTIAVETDVITLNAYKALQTAVSAQIISLGDVISDIRSIKNEDELQLLKTSQAIAEKSFTELLNFVKEGISEKEIEAYLTYQLIKNGSDSGNFGICCVSGENSSLIHGRAGQRRIKKGDNILLDFGAIYKGYYSDMTRTFCVGTPKEDFLQAYHVVLKANQDAIAQLKADIPCRLIDKTARDIIDQSLYAGFFTHGLGHGVGIDIHENPRLSAQSKDILHRGNVVTVEPGVYIPQKFGIRIEDMLYIDDNSCTNLTSITKQLIVL